MSQSRHAKRARRRQDAKRMFKRAERLTRLVWSEADEPEIARRACRIRDHQAHCSCPQCGNPRRSRLSKGWQKLTIQERRARLG